MTITSEDRARFEEQGFLIVPNLIALSEVERVRDRFEALFAGKFETGVYPDEWHWRAGMSLPDVTRHMANAWKSDLTVARLVLSERIGEIAARLAGWPGARLGQDTVWWKPPSAKTVTFHQDTSFMDFLNPAQTMTCWVALDDTHRDAGTLEYAPGSHRWPLTPIPEAFHAVEDYRAPMLAAAAASGIAAPEPVYVEVPAGSCVFHCGEAWHGSGPNRTGDRVRRSIGIHMLPPDAEFSDRGGGYIYRRYQLTGSRRLDESFFPVLWSEEGTRTGWIDGYLTDGQRR